VSVYYLLIELLNNGSAGLMPEIEPLVEEDIMFELERRTGKSYGSQKDEWGKWFIRSTDCGTELERANLMIFMRLRAHMIGTWENLNRTEPEI
jgi:hypothetical protein